MPVAYWYWITAWGDSAVMLPLAACLAIWLGLEQARRAMWQWLGMFIPALAFVVGTKLAYLGWGLGIASLDFRGVSGHSFNTSLLLPVWFAFLWVRRSKLATAGAWLAGMVCALLVAYSRVLLGFHSVSEVVSGLFLGGCISLLYLRSAAAIAFQPKFRIYCLVLVLAIGLMLHGIRAPTDELLANVAKLPIERAVSVVSHGGAASAK